MLIILLVILAVGLPTAGFPEDVPDDLTLTNQTISSDKTYTANESITAGPGVNVQGNANVYFHIIEEI